MYQSLTLKQELTYAEFRVQVMRNESPKRQRQRPSNHQTVLLLPKLMEQLKEEEEKNQEVSEGKQWSEEMLL